MLERMGLVASMNVTWEHMASVRTIAERFPNLQLVVDHTGSPLGRSPRIRWQLAARHGHRRRRAQRLEQDLRPGDDRL